MEKSAKIQKEIELEAKVCKNLCALAEESGISTFLDVDIDEITDGDFDDTPEEILKRLKQAHKSIHEALYAPPRK